MHMDTRIFPDLDSLSRAAMYEMLAIVRDAIASAAASRSRSPGGTRPQKCTDFGRREPYRGETPWDRVHLFWGDERYVPHGRSAQQFPHDARNPDFARADSSGKRASGADSARPAGKSAEAYEQELRKFFGALPCVRSSAPRARAGRPHCVAFPGFARARRKAAWVVAGGGACNAATAPDVDSRGAESRHATHFSSWRARTSAKSSPLCAASPIQPSQYPAARIRPSGRVLWFLDQAAAGR